jgi:hypothetical protein
MRQGVAAIRNVSSPSKEDQSRKAYFLGRLSSRTTRKEERDSIMTEIVQIANQKGAEADEQILCFAGYILLGQMGTKFCVTLSSAQQTRDGCQALAYSSIKWSPTGRGGADLHNGLTSEGRIYVQFRLGSLWPYAWIVMSYQHPDVLLAPAALVMGEGGCYAQDTVSLYNFDVHHPQMMAVI